MFSSLVYVTVLGKYTTGKEVLDKEKIYLWKRKFFGETLRTELNAEDLLVCFYQ